MDEVALKIGNLLYEGWKSIQISRSMESIAGSFTLQVTERWTDSETLPILPGLACQVLVGDVPLITGYVDEVTSKYSATSHDISISGRDKTGDLVDCSAVHKVGQWRKVKLLDLARELCKPFSIPVLSEVGTGDVVEVFSLQEGETVFSALERAARAEGVLLVSDGLGQLVLTQAGAKQYAHPLILGQNLIESEHRKSIKERFSVYQTQGQQAMKDEVDNRDGILHNRYQDSAITRYRPLIVHADGAETLKSLERRARWERNVRRGKGTTINCTVQGWRNGNTLWETNRRIQYQNGTTTLDTLITSVELTLSEEGTMSHLTLMPPEAFELEPLQVKQKATKKPKEEKPLW